MAPADSASRTGAMPKASGDSSLGTFENEMASIANTLNLNLPHWFTAAVIPVAAFYTFGFLMWCEGWETMGTCIYAYRAIWFWVFYVLPVAIIIGLLGHFLPRIRRAIDWSALLILFFALYFLSPRISS
jgi:hypothetical protein